MPGQFSLSNLPVLPGAYVNFVTAPGVPVPVSVGAVVCVPFTSDWGPFNTAVTVGSLAEYMQVFGPSTTTPGYYAVAQAFRGEGVGGRGGAGAVLCYRLGGSAKANATRILTNTTPATALTLTAKYPGALGNSLTVTVQDYAADAAQTEIIFYLGGVQVESYHFLDTNIANAAAQINASSAWATAVSNITGVALSLVSAQAFTAGADGGTLATGDWTAGFTALGAFRFGVFAPYDLSDTTVVASLKTWQAALNAGGRRFMTVLGGALNEAYSVAKTRATTMNDYNVCSIGVGSVQDSQLFDTNGVAMVFSSAQLAPRVAGALANRGEGMSLTFSRYAGLTLLVGGTLQNMSDAYTDGLMLFESDSNANPVRINRARTTYGVASDAAHPISIFSEPKFVRTMQNFEMEITEYGEDGLIGVLPVNDKTRQTVVGEARDRLRRREEANIIQHGWTVVIGSNPAPDDSQRFIKLDYSLKFGRSLEQILNSITVG